MNQRWIFMCIMAIIVMVNCHAIDVRVDVIPTGKVFSAKRKVSVLLRYTNLGDESIGIYKWNLPNKKLDDPMFEVTRDGEAVKYVGRMIKRDTPTIRDLIVLAPGSTRSTIVDVSSVYDMTKSGMYKIQFKRHIAAVLTTMNNLRTNERPSSRGMERSTLLSRSITVFAAGRRNRLMEEAKKAWLEARWLQPTFSNCDDDRINKIKQAMGVAESYANDAVQYLNGEPGDKPRYTTWFGNYNSANWDKVKSGFTKIKGAIDEKILSFNCLCQGVEDSTHAYVYPNAPYEIYLCNQYWRSPISGTNSNAGAIIHELSHFEVIAGTNDNKYGTEDCKNLAQQDPSKAIETADNFEYFAENDPPLN